MAAEISIFDAVVLVIRLLVVIRFGAPVSSRVTVWATVWVTMKIVRENCRTTVVVRACDHFLPDKIDCISVQLDSFIGVGDVTRGAFARFVGLLNV